MTFALLIAALILFVIAAINGRDLVAAGLACLTGSMLL